MKKTVMIVDDSIFLYEEMKRMLADSDFELIAYARTGEDAVALFPDIKPTLVTMDIVLPGMDGLEAAKRILAIAPQTKIVMVSSFAYDETVNQAKAIGALDFLFKPFEQSQLVDALKWASRDQQQEI